MSRAWIIGNGPSLMDTPLHLLKDEDTFAVNNIHKIFPHTDWRPKYYVRTDEPFDTNHPKFGRHLEQPDTYWSVVDDMKPILDEVEYAFLGPFFYEPCRREGYEGKVQNILPICGEQQWHINDGPRCVPQQWHTYPNRRMKEYCSFGGSLSVAIQVAIFGMGKKALYDEIYLVGCDLGFAKEKNHFVEKYFDYEPAKVPPEILQADKIHAHTIAKKCSPIPIFNATIGGELEIYHRVDIMEVLCQ